MKKVIVIQCDLMNADDLQKLWKCLCAMYKVGLLLLPKYCELVDIIEYEEKKEKE